MARNIEIKAKAKNFSKQMELASHISTREMEIIAQEDIFFNTQDGRLKLRIFSKNKAELIFYKRMDQQGPKLSQYEISPTNNPGSLKSILTKVNGIKASVIKTRYLFMSGRTRIHFDKVENLGEFIELEVVLTEGEDLEEGKLEAEALMGELNIEAGDLIEGAYVDMILNLQS